MADGNPKNKTYVVYNGREPGIYKSWDEAKEQVHRYSNADHKSYKSMEAAAHDIFSRGSASASKNEGSSEASVKVEYKLTYEERYQRK